MLMTISIPEHRTLKRRRTPIPAPTQRYPSAFMNSLMSVLMEALPSLNPLHTLIGGYVSFDYVDFTTMREHLSHETRPLLYQAVSCTPERPSRISSSTSGKRSLHTLRVGTALPPAMVAPHTLLVPTIVQALRHVTANAHAACKFQKTEHIQDRGITGDMQFGYVLAAPVWSCY
jgi:hypothetical protein